MVNRNVVDGFVVEVGVNELFEERNFILESVEEKFEKNLLFVIVFNLRSGKILFFIIIGCEFTLFVRFF